MTVAFAIGLSIQELKRHLAAELRVPADVLQISVDGKMDPSQPDTRQTNQTPTLISSEHSLCFQYFFNLGLIFTCLVPPQRFCFPPCPSVC